MGKFNQYNTTSIYFAQPVSLPAPKMLEPAPASSEIADDCFQKTKISFLTFPRELRDLVYEAALVGRKPLIL